MTEAATTTAKRLTDPQTKRLTQIQLQLRGLGVFSSGSAAAPSVCGRLHITPAQAAKIEAVFTDTGKQVQALPRPVLGGGTREELEKATAERNRRAAEIARKGLAEVLATFDAGQKAAWRELTGEPFDVTKVGTGLTPTPFFSPVPNQGLIANALVSEATSDIDRGEYAAALAAFDEAIRLAPKNPSFRTRKASLLATCPSGWARDGKQAVELMKAVMAETKEPGSGDYIVLAVAHAEAGQFDEAVKAQEKAIELLAKRRPSPVGTSNAQLKEQYEARLKLYREKKPYHMDPPWTRAER